MPTIEFKVGDHVEVIKRYDETEVLGMKKGIIVSTRSPNRPLIQFPGCDGHEGNSLDREVANDWTEKHGGSGRDFYYVSIDCLRKINRKVEL
jgi:hypothetical protein